MMESQSRYEPIYALWEGANDAAVFVGLMPIDTLQAMLKLSQEQAVEVVLEIGGGNGWCTREGDAGKIYHITYNSELWQVAGEEPRAETA